MYRIKYIFVIFALILLVAGCSNNSEDVSVSETLLSTIKLLPETRELGTDEEIKTCTILKDMLEKFNYNVELQKIKYSLSENGIAIESGKPFPTNLKKIKDGETHNIIARQKQYDFSKKDILIVAHYDTTSFPGVNDNASGVAVLVELAKKFDKTDKFSLIYVLFSGEENFLLGSEHFVNKLSEKEKNNIAAVINLDTLSGNSTPEISFAEQDYTPAYFLFEKTFEKYFSVNLNPPYSSGDEIPFNGAGIPSLSIGQEGENLHTTEDTLDNLDVNDLVKVYIALSETLNSL